jgi:hypothetical protein
VKRINKEEGKAERHALCTYSHLSASVIERGIESETCAYSHISARVIDLNAWHHAIHQVTGDMALRFNRATPADLRR